MSQKKKLLLTSSLYQGGDAKRIEALFRRCLVTCSNYPEFWAMFVSWLEDVRGDLPLARETLLKGRSIYLKSNVSLYTLSSELEEAAGNIASARALLVEIDQLRNWKDLDVILKRVAFEKRQKNFEECERLLSMGVQGIEERSVLLDDVKVKLGIFRAYFVMDIYQDVKRVR